MSKRCGDKPARKEAKFTCSKCGVTAEKKSDVCKPVNR